MHQDTELNHPTPLLRVNGLNVRYPDGATEVEAVRSFDFWLAPGESLGLLGESGCGKTSLAMALVGLLPPQASVSGRVEFQAPIKRLAPASPAPVLPEAMSLLQLDEAGWQRVRGEHVGVVFQQPAQALSPYRLVGRQIADVLRAHGRTERISERVAQLLSEVGLDADVAAAHPHQLSGGQLQRIVLCRALSCDPDLLLADEPTASLDSETETRILDLVGRLRRERDLALLWISHDPDVLERVSDRLLVMNEGRIVERGETARVLSAPQHEFTRHLLSCRLDEPLRARRTRSRDD